MPQEIIMLQTAEHLDTPTECKRMIRDQIEVSDLVMGHFFRYHTKRYCVRAKTSSVWYEVPCTFPAVIAYESFRANGS
jgi:hypothetical protein